jgi:hypothetical protein
MTTFSHLSRLISSLCCVLALTGIFSVTSASAKDQIVLCTIDDLSGDFSIMSTPKTYGYKLAVKEINDAGGIQVDGAKKTIKLVSYDGQSDIKRYQELAQRCVFNEEADVVMAGYTGAEREAARKEVVRNKTIYWHNNQGEGGIAVVIAGAAAAERLNRPVHDLLRHVRPNHLDHGDLLSRNLVTNGVHHIRRLQRQKTRLLDHNARFSNALKRHRLLGNLAAECGAFFCTPAWLFQNTFTESDHAHAVMDPPGAEPALGDLEALPLAEQHVGRRNTHIGKGHL